MTAQNVPSIRVQQVFVGEAQELLDLSPDGRLILARGYRERKCADEMRKCVLPVIVVYPSVGGKPVGEIEGGESGSLSARFVSGDTVEAVAYFRAGASRLHWNLTTLKVVRTELEVAMSGAVPALPCATVGEQVYNSVRSPDGSLVVVVIGRMQQKEGADNYVMGPTDRLALEVRAGEDCHLLRRFKLQLPDKLIRSSPLFAPKNVYWANARMFAGFARSLAISPDNRKVAFAYGVRTDGIYSDARSFFALFSLTNGSGLGLWEGDRFKNGWWETIRMMDTVPTNFAHLGEKLVFSPDSKILYGNSKLLFKLDIAATE